MIDIQLFRTIGQGWTGLAKQDRGMAGCNQSSQTRKGTLVDLKEDSPPERKAAELSTIPRMMLSLKLLQYDA